MANESTLSQAPDATKFLQALSTKSSRKVELGDPDAFTPSPANYPLQAHETVEQGLKKVRSLADDKTRTLVQKHDAARQIVTAMCNTLEQCKAGIEKQAAALSQQFENEIAEALDVEKIGPKTYGLIVDWVRAQAKEPEGVSRIRQKVESDRDVAAVIFASKGFLLGLSDETSERLTETAYKKHAPGALPKYDRAQKLAKWAGKYPQVQRSLHASCYNKALADQVATRVEL